MYGLFGFVEKFNIQNYVNSTGIWENYLYGIFGFEEKLNIQNFVNSAGNCVHYICTECLDFTEIEYLELCKFNGKWCTLYVWNVWILDKMKIQNCINSMGNSVHHLYGMSGFLEKLNIQNVVNSAGNCTHYICTECQDLQRNWIS